MAGNRSRDSETLVVPIRSSIVRSIFCNVVPRKPGRVPWTTISSGLDSSDAEVDLDSVAMEEDASIESELLDDGSGVVAVGAIDCAKASVDHAMKIAAVKSLGFDIAVMDGVGWFTRQGLRSAIGHASAGYR